MKKLLLILAVLLSVNAFTQVSYSTSKTTWNIRTSDVHGRKPIHADFSGYTIRCYNTTDSLMYQELSGVIIPVYFFYPYSTTSKTPKHTTVTSNNRYGYPKYQYTIRTSTIRNNYPLPSDFTSPTVVCINYTDSCAYRMIKGVITKVWKIFPYQEQSTPVVTYNTYYVANNGNDNNPGTIIQPFLTLNKAWTVVNAGDIIYMRGGSYGYNNTQYLRNKSGTAGNLIKIWAYPNETPVITRGAGWGSPGDFWGVDFEGSYVHWKGIEFANFIQPQGDANYGASAFFSGDNCNNCIFELINYHHSTGTFKVWGNSSNNLFLNCDFHHVSDPYTPGAAYGNGDGLDLAFMTANTTNTVRGCRFWRNSDDGFDLWSNPGYVVVDSCWSWNNGYIGDTWNTGGNGDGFKFGVYTDQDLISKVGRKVTNCIAFGNRQSGFNQNQAYLIMQLYNNVAYHNGFVGFLFNAGGWSLDIAHVLHNNISYTNGYNTWIDFTDNLVQDHNSWTLGVTVNNSDFVSIDSTQLDNSRQANGSLPIITFLNLITSSDLINVGINVGLPYLGIAPDLGTFEKQ